VTEDTLPVTYAPGGFLNYDLRFDRTAGLTSLGANWEVGAFARAGPVHLQLLQRQQRPRHDPPRHGLPPRRSGAHHELSSGDTITRPAATARGAHGGLQYQRNFATAPLLITYPTADVAGTAAVPVDGRRLHRQRQGLFDAGQGPVPFSVSNLPSRSAPATCGWSCATCSARRRRQVVPYVRYDAMLKAGPASTFPTKPAGAAPRLRGQEQRLPATGSAVATHRYGVTDRVTIEGRAEAMADRGDLGGVVQITDAGAGLGGRGRCREQADWATARSARRSSSVSSRAGASAPRPRQRAPEFSTSPTSRDRSAPSACVSSRRPCGSAGPTG
jgi:outer membrane usher protein